MPGASGAEGRRFESHRARREVQGKQGLTSESPTGDERKKANPWPFYKRLAAEAALAAYLKVLADGFAAPFLPRGQA
jgi:hypothetical protein